MKNDIRCEYSLNTRKLDPQKAAEYLNRIGAQITNTSNDLSQRVLDDGGRQIVTNHLFPLFGTNERVDINMVQGTPDKVDTDANSEENNIGEQNEK